MVTVAEKEASLATLLDDIATTATGLSAWSEADAGVVNDGATEDIQNNARVLANSNTGTFLLMYVEHGGAGFQSPDGSGAMVGIRFLHCSDWNTTESIPAGWSNGIEGTEEFFRDVQSYRRNSYEEVQRGQNVRGNDTDDLDTSNNDSSIGLWIRDGNNPNTRIDARSLPITYFLSIRNDGITGAVWDSNDSNNGIASWIAYEYVDNKWWADQVNPVVIAHQNSAYNDPDYVNSVNLYGFKTWAAQYNDVPHGSVGTIRGAVESVEWGTLNPDANDDTFFYKRPSIYYRQPIIDWRISNVRYRPYQAVPVAQMGSVIPNKPGAGAAHGDTITAGGTDYRAMVQSGASITYDIGVALQFE